MTTDATVFFFLKEKQRETKTEKTGGNDAQLLNVLNQCIYQWASFDSLQVTTGQLAKIAAEPWAQGIDFDTLGRGCGRQLQATEDFINGQEFSDRLDSLLSATKKKLAKE